MTAESIMTSRLKTIHPNDTVAHAVLTMHKYQVRNLPVVDDNGNFVGLFGVRRLRRILLPTAATKLDRYSLVDLSFLPDEMAEIHDRLRKAGNRPVSEFLEKKRKLIFCNPDTTFPKLLKLLDHSSDASLPVIILDDSNQERKLVGMISVWDVLEKIATEVFLTPSQENSSQQAEPES